MQLLYNTVALPDGDLILRLLLATLAGALVGFERELHGHLAGLRTHALVAAGAALFTLVGAYGFPELTRGPNVDPMRVAAQIVSGIGFIGAGAIIRDRGEVRGVTTAAALWASAALGMAAGAGMYWATIAGLGTVLLALAGLRLLRERGIGQLTGSRQDVDLTYRRGHGTLAPLMQAVEDSGATLEQLRIDDDGQARHVALRVRTRNGVHLEQRLRDVAERAEVHELTIDSVELTEGDSGRR